MDLEQVTENQEWLMARHSRTVGQVLDVIEASLPEGTQCEKVKKLIQQHLYALRNDVLKVISIGRSGESLLTISRARIGLNERGIIFLLAQCSGGKICSASLVFSFRKNLINCSLLMARDMALLNSALPSHESLKLKPK